MLGDVPSDPELPAVDTDVLVLADAATMLGDAWTVAARHGQRGGRAAAVLRDAARAAGAVRAEVGLEARLLLVAEGHAIPVARVQAMHEGKRRARVRRKA